MSIQTSMAGAEAWPELHRARRAIVVVDVVESVRLMQQHEDDVIDRWRRFVNEVRTRVLPSREGRLVKSLGDGLLLEFKTVPAAVSAALDIQLAVHPYNHGVAASAAMQLRVGLHVAEIVIDELDLYGSGVNLAARLASLAGPGEVVASAEVRDQLVADLDAEIEDLGECYLKHVPEPVRAYRLGRSDMPALSVDAMPLKSLRPAIAVLPLAGPTDGSAASMFGDLLSSALNAQLSRSNAIDVISRLSLAGLSGRTISMSDLQARLQVNYLLSGQCRVVNDRLHVSIELAETRKGHVVWAESLHGSTAELLQGDSELVREVTARVTDAVMAQELRHGGGTPIHSIDDHALLLNGIALLHRTSSASFERARVMLESLIERLPRHPEPRAWLAKWYVMRLQQGWSDSPEQDGQRALDCTSRALDLDGSHAFALTMDGLVQVHFRKRLDLGALRYAQALQSNPNEALAWINQGTLHAFRGEGDEAVHDTQRALRLSPLDPLRYYYDSLAASAAASAAQYDAAVALAQRSLRANATHVSTLRVLAIAQSMLGHEAEARATVERLLLLDGGFNLRAFRKRAPGAGFEIAERFADALKRAGVPE